MNADAFKMEKKQEGGVQIYKQAKDYTFFVFLIVLN